jgi:tellurite resistance protein
MVFFIIYGTKGVEKVIKGGRFHCPSCGPDQAYSLKEVRRYFTLYFIPLIPLDSLGKFVECTRGCRQTFQLEVLSYDPAADQEELEAEFRTVMRRVMIDMMMADGEMGQDELKTVAKIYEDVGGKPLSKRRLKAELARLEEEGHEGTVDYLREAQGFLNDEGRLMVLRAALAVAAADGEFQQEEQDLMAEYADAVGLSGKQYKALIQEVFDIG